MVAGGFFADDYVVAGCYPHHAYAAAHYSGADYGDGAGACVGLGPWGGRHGGFGGVCLRLCCCDGLSKLNEESWEVEVLGHSGCR